VKSSVLYKAIAAWIAVGSACSIRSASFTPADAVLPGNVEPLVFLQRAARNDAGDIFQYTSYVPGARLVKLQPPAPDGTLTPICCDQAGAEYAAIDISGFDLSFDARSIVFSAQRAADQHYGLFVVQLDDGTVTQLATDPQRDFVSGVVGLDPRLEPSQIAHGGAGGAGAAKISQSCPNATLPLTLGTAMMTETSPIGASRRIRSRHSGRSMSQTLSRARRISSRASRSQNGNARIRAQMCMWSAAACICAERSAPQVVRPARWRRRRRGCGRRGRRR